MAQFNKNRDYYFVLQSLSKYFSFYHIEMQLVWLLEILLVKYFLYERSLPCSEAIADDEDDPSICYLTPKGLGAFVRMNSLDQKCLRHLIKFRNTYVHQGSDLAHALFKYLMEEYYADLVELAKFAGVVLNSQRSIYKSVEHRS